MTVLAILGIFALLFIAFGLWVRAKVRRGVAWLKVTLLEKAVEELHEKANKPGAEVDEKRADLIARADAALAKTKAAWADHDVRGVSEAADAMLKELLELVAEQAKKEVDEEEKARKGTLVIDVTTTTADPAATTSCAAPGAGDTTKALPAPEKVEPKTDGDKQ